MISSSRTPEGDPNQCPICGYKVRLEPSIDTRDAPCPGCGHLLWFSQNPFDLADTEIRESQARLSKQLMEIVEINLGPPTETARRELKSLPTGNQWIDRFGEIVEAENWDEVLTLVSESEA